MKKLTYIFVLISWSLSAQLSQLVELSSLSTQNWEFRKKGKADWKPARVPGSVYTDLQSNNIISDPYLAANERSVQWVEETAWEYRTNFSLGEQQLSAFTHADLAVEGIDTYANVYLNDSLVLACDNMFRKWTREIKPLLKEGVNTLRFVFEPAVTRAKAEAAKLSYQLPEGERVFARKAQYQFGWDFAPRLAGCGINGNVSIHFWKEMRIRDFHILQVSTNSSEAVLKAKAEVEAETAQPVKLSLVSDKVPGLRLNKTLTLKKGLNTIEFDLNIQNPELWWCNGLGRPNLYNFNLTISDSKNETIAAEKKTGLRTLELVRDKDGKGRSFYFKLNGKAVFIKGANYIPPDAIVGRNTDINFPALAAKMNMNMLRVWGGGLYPGDDFYAQCDEQGILVWQDFMFACAMYPGDEHFLANVKQEVTEQVKRLRDHASLVLFCGNNESDEGWRNWGWQKQYKLSATDSAKIAGDYKKLFHELIPGIVRERSPAIAYVPSSPEIGWGHSESLLQGDSHYWGVWWGKEPFENYNVRVGRFVSEYGFQSLPAFSSVKNFSDEADPGLSSPSVLQHQKNANGFQTIQTYMDRDFKTPEKFGDYIYVSQLLQARGMSVAIEAHRRGKPYCMGSLFWQLNDCWPAVSWSAIDYYKEPKAFYYYARRLYQTVVISVQEKRDSLRIALVSDSLEAMAGSLDLALKDFHGKVLWQKKIPAMMDANTVKQISISRKELPDFDTAAVYLDAGYSVNGKALTKKIHCFARPKYLQLPRATLSIKKISPAQYAVSSDVFAMDVYLYSDKGGLFLSDNFFNLEPGVIKTVSLEGSYIQAENPVPHAVILNNLINLH